jgi:hypothetical protein
MNFDLLSSNNYVQQENKYMNEFRVYICTYTVKIGSSL